MYSVNGMKYSFCGTGQQRGQEHAVLRVYGVQAEQLLDLAAKSPNKERFNCSRLDVAIAADSPEEVENARTRQAFTVFPSTQRRFEQNKKTKPRSVLLVSNGFSNNTA